jgi:hypothetical protein
MPAQKEILVVNDENYKDFLLNPNLVLMMGLQGGYRCELFKSGLEQIAGRFSKVSFGVTWMRETSKIRKFMQEHPNLFAEFDVPPTTVFVKDGLVERSLTGFYPPEEVRTEISRVFQAGSVILGTDKKVGSPAVSLAVLAKGVFGRLRRG